MHHISLTQAVIEAFERLPLIASFVKAGGLFNIVIRRDPESGRYWRCTYRVTPEGKVPKELQRSGPPDGEKL